MNIDCIFDWSRMKLFALLSFERMMVRYLLPMAYPKSLMQCYTLVRY